MPIKVKKDKAKQKQKQRQSQVVNIKIGDVKKQAIRRRKRETKAILPVQQTVQPVQYLYQATGSMPYQNVGVSQPLASANILGQVSAVPARVLGKADPLQIGQISPAKGNIFDSPNFTIDDLTDQDIKQRRIYSPSPSSKTEVYGNESDRYLLGSSSASSSITAETRAPRAFRNKPTLIREILRATTEYSPADLQAMSTNQVREIYVKFYP